VTTPIEIFRAALTLDPDVEAARPEDYGKVFDHVRNAMSVPELAMLWRALQHVGVRDDTPETWPVRAAFDALWFEDAERSYTMILEVLRTEPDRRVLRALAERPFVELLDRHWDWAAPRVAAEAPRNAGLRWLLGSFAAGCGEMDDTDAVALSLLRLADTKGWNGFLDAQVAAEPDIDLDALSPGELARIWLDAEDQPLRGGSEVWYRIQDLGMDLPDLDPGKAIDLIVAMVRQEENENLLALTAGALLDRVLSENSVGRLVAAAARDARFAAWLGRQSLPHHPATLVAKLRVAGAQG
jgi:hypothetical protein